jgi:hypothetical protein
LSVKLSGDVFADVLYGFADFTPGGPECFLSVPACAFGSALSSHLIVVDGAAHVLFDSALGLIEFAFDFVTVR